MKTIFSPFLMQARRWWFGVVWLPAALCAAPSDPQTAGPVGVTKPFHGTIRARDPRLGTLSLGSGNRISRVLALDINSRLFKGMHPAFLADFAIGDLVEGYAFPDAYGRVVIAAATAQARSISPRESKAPKSGKAGHRKGATPARAGKAPTVPSDFAPSASGNEPWAPAVRREHPASASLAAPIRAIRAIRASSGAKK